MPVPNRSNIRRSLAALALACAVFAGLAFAVPVARAQAVKPWVPAGDALLDDVTNARMKFKRQQGDSVGGDNYEAFDVVGRLGRRLLVSLGRERTYQAPAIAAALDSLGLDVEVVFDPQTPSMVLMVVRNPFRLTSHAVGFLYWYALGEVRMQGASFPPSRDFKMRAWFTGRDAAPYEAAILFTVRGEPFHTALKLLRMTPDGRFWNLVQHEGNGPDFGARAATFFVDVNNDGRPEIVSYHPVDPDTFVVLRPDVPPILNEFLYTERPEGYVLHELRTVDGPAEVLRLWANMLADKQWERAKRLMLKPERLQDAIANGWPALHGRDAWVVEYGEADQKWPEWLEVRTNGPQGRKRWIFHFTILDTRWVIRDWIPVVERTPAGVTVKPGMVPRDSAAVRKP